MRNFFESDISINHLSDELIIGILHFCNYRAILHFALTCRAYYQLVANTTNLLLHIELDASGLEITDRSLKPASYLSILAELQRYQDAWLYLNLGPEVKHSGAEGEMLWELREGVYVTAFPSPDSQGRPNSFQLIPLGSPNVFLPSLKFHTNFHEFTLDLKQELAALIAADTESATRATIHLRSTISGLPHPYAQHAVLAVELDFSIPYQRAFSIVLEIMGDILLVKFEDYSRKCEIVTWDWKTGALLQRVDPCGRVCDFSFLDKNHIILCSYSPCEDSDDRQQSLALQVYNVSSVSDYDVPLDSRYIVPLYPLHHPVLKFGFPRLHQVYDTFPIRLSMRSYPPPGRAIHTNSATFACSHALTLGLVITLSRRPGMRNDLEDRLTFRIFMDGSKLLNHVNDLKYRDGILIPWEEWGSNATRWFVQDEHNEEDWVYWISGSRYTRTGLHSMAYGSDLLSVVDFRTPTVSRSSIPASESNLVVSQAAIQIEADKHVILDGKRLISTTFLGNLVKGEFHQDSLSDRKVFIETVGRDLPTIISAGFENAFESRLPYRIVTHPRPVQVHEGWLIEGDHIIGVNPLGGAVVDKSVYKLEVSAKLKD